MNYIFVLLTLTQIPPGSLLGKLFYYLIEQTGLYPDWAECQRGEGGELNVMWVLFVSQLTSSTLDNWLSPPWSCHTWFTPLYFLSEVTTRSSMDHQETSNCHQPSAAFTCYYLMKYIYVVWLTYQVFMREKKWPKYHVSPRYTYINLFHTLSRHTL